MMTIIIAVLCVKHIPGQHNNGINDHQATQLAPQTCEMRSSGTVATGDVFSAEYSFRRSESPHAQFTTTSDGESSNNNTPSLPRVDW